MEKVAPRVSRKNCPPNVDYFRIFDGFTNSWVKIKRTEKHGPGMWLVEVTDHSGTQVVIQILSKTEADNIWYKYRDKEVFYYDNEEGSEESLNF